MCTFWPKNRMKWTRHYIGKFAANENTFWSLCNFQAKMGDSHVLLRAHLLPPRELIHFFPPPKKRERLSVVAAFSLEVWLNVRFGRRTSVGGGRILKEWQKQSLPIQFANLLNCHYKNLIHIKCIRYLFHNTGILFRRAEQSLGKFPRILLDWVWMQLWM